MNRSGPPHSVRTPLLPLVLIGLCTTAVALVLGIVLGSVYVPLDAVARVVADDLLGRPPDPNDALAHMIVHRLRVPRVLAAALVGAALTLAGTVLQALVRNPLADPYVLGVSAGASLGAVAVMSSASALWLRNLGVPLAALIGAALALAAVLVLASRNGQITGARIVLAGVATGNVAMAATSLIQLKSEPAEIRGMLFWMLGSVAGVQQLSSLIVPVVLFGFCALWLLARARALNAMLMGDDDARALGYNVRTIRIELIIVVAILTGSAVAVAGGVAFVGLIVPHCVRFLTGPDHRRLLPIGVLAGAAFLVLIDLGARILDIPNEYPLTIFTAALGGPFFLWLLKRSNTGGAM